MLLFEVFSDLGLNWVLRARFFLLKNKQEISSYISTLILVSLILRVLFSLILFFAKDYIFPRIFDSWTLYYSDLLDIQILIFLGCFTRNAIIPILILESSTTKYLFLILTPYFFQLVTSLFFLIKIKRGLTSLLYGELVGSLLLLLLSILFLKKYITYKINFNAISDILSIGLPSVPKNIFGQIQANLNKYFIIMYMSTFDLGIFQKSDFLNGVFKGFYLSVGNTIAPNNLKKIAQNKEDYQTVPIIIQFLYILSVMITAAIFFLEDVFILMGVNPEFLICAKYAPLYGYNILITSFIIMFNHNILIAEKTNFFIFSSFIGLVTSVISNVIMIPKYGIIGGILSVILVSFMTVISSIIYSEVFLSYKTKINYGAWILTLISVLFLYILSFNSILDTVALKIITLLLYTIFLVIIDKYFIFAINWETFSRKNN